MLSLIQHLFSYSHCFSLTHHKRCNGQFRLFAITISIFCWSAVCWSPLAGCVCRHLSSLHVDPGVCRLVRWLSRAQQTSQFFIVRFIFKNLLHELNVYTYWII